MRRCVEFNPSMLTIAGHCAAARKLAEEQFAAPKVLQSILEDARVL